MDGGAVVAPAPVPMRQQSRRPSLTSAASTNSRLCSCVVKEIIATERQYVSDLRDLVDGYLAYCRRHDFLTTTDIHDIFGNIEAIYSLNSTFLADVESCTEDPVRVANCFLQRSPEFEVYGAYCTNYPRSQATLAYVLAKPTVHEAFHCQQDSLGHSLPLSSYLHKPVQRVLKYPLLLQNLLKYYDCQGEGRRCIEAALLAIREMANHINESKRASEHAAQAQQLLGSSHDEYDASDCGDLLMMGDFKLHGAKSYRHLFLFEKAVILAKRRDGDGETAYRKTVIKGSDLMLIESVPKEPLCFHLIHYRTPRKLYALQAKSQDEKRAWCIGIKQLIIGSLPGTIPDRSKRLLLSTGLEQSSSSGASGNGEGCDLLSPLTDGVPPMSSLAAVAAAAAAAAPPAKQTWLKSPNLLLRSNARQVPDYLERRRRKGPQFRSYVDLSHFVRKHLARRSDSVLSNGSYHDDSGKTTAVGDVGISTASEDSQCTAAALSPSQHSLTGSLYRWGSSSSGLARSRSVGCLDVDACRADPTSQRSKLGVGSSYDDCCSRAHSLARLLAEKGVGEALTELTSAAYESPLDRTTGGLHRVARKSKHRTAFHGRPRSELHSPEEELVHHDSSATDLQPTSACTDDLAAGVAMLPAGKEKFAAAAAAAATASSTVWPELRRHGTTSSDEGYGQGGPESDVQQQQQQPWVRLRGSVSNRSSGADFSSPSRCSIASSDTGSSSCELGSADNDIFGSCLRNEGPPVLLVTSADGQAVETDQAFEADGKLSVVSEVATAAAVVTDRDSAAGSQGSPASDQLDVDEHAGRADQSAATAGLLASSAAAAPDECSMSADAESDASELRGSRCSSSSSDSDGSQADVAFGEPPADERYSSSRDREPVDKSCDERRDAAVSERAAGAMSANFLNEQSPVTLNVVPGAEPADLSESCHDKRPLMQEVAASCAVEQFESHQSETGHAAGKQDSPAAETAVAVPSVFRLARQYSTKIKERPPHATITRKGGMQQRGNRKVQQQDMAARENLTTSAKRSLASLVEQDGFSSEDGQDKGSKPLDLSATCFSETGSVSCATAEHVESKQLVTADCRGVGDAPTSPGVRRVQRERTRANSASPDAPSVRSVRFSDATDGRCSRSPGRAISAALRERIRSLERPPAAPRIFTFAEIDGQQVDSLKDRIRMLQTSSSVAAAVAAAPVVAPTKDKHFRDLTPPAAKAVSKASKTVAYNRCHSLPSDAVERATSPLHTAVVAKVTPGCSAAVGMSSRKPSRTEDAAVSSGYVRNIVQKFQVH